MKRHCIIFLVDAVRLARSAENVVPNLGDGTLVPGEKNRSHIATVGCGFLPLFLSIFEIPKKAGWMKRKGREKWQKKNMGQLEKGLWMRLDAACGLL